MMENTISILKYTVKMDDDWPFCPISGIPPRASKCPSVTKAVTICAIPTDAETSKALVHNDEIPPGITWG